MSPTLTCPACGARWHTAARRGRLPATETCLRCGGPLSEVIEESPSGEDTPTSVIDALRDAWQGGDRDRALALCHPEIEILEIEALLPGHEARFVGIDGARRWLELINEWWDLEFLVDLRERRVLSDRSIELVCEVEARSSGAPPDFVATTRSVWQFDEGKLRRVEFRVASAGAQDGPRA